MTKHFTPLILIALFVSALFGWIRAATTAGPQPAIVDGWNILEYGRLSKRDYEVMTARIKTSSLLPSLNSSIDSEANAGVLGSEDEQTKAPPFPKVLGFSVLNNVSYIIVSESENKNLRVKEGDILNSGWSITSITNKHVLATHKDQEVKVAIVSYLQTAFEKTAEDAMNIISKDNSSLQSTQFSGE